MRKRLKQAAPRNFRYGYKKPVTVSTNPSMTTFKDQRAGFQAGLSHKNQPPRIMFTFITTKC
jgi:hypothetical protein